MTTDELIAAVILGAVIALIYVLTRPTGFDTLRAVM